jgi:hypothetical protein
MKASENIEKGSLVYISGESVRPATRKEFYFKPPTRWARFVRWLGRMTGVKRWRNFRQPGLVDYLQELTEPGEEVKLERVNDSWVAVFDEEGA